MGGTPRDLVQATLPKPKLTLAEYKELKLKFMSVALAQGCIGSNPVGLANLNLTFGANIHLGCFA